MKKSNNSNNVFVEFYIYDGERSSVRCVNMSRKKYDKLHKKELAVVKAARKRAKRIKAIKEFIVYISAMFSFTSIMALLLYIRLV